MRQQMPPVYLCVDRIKRAPGPQPVLQAADEWEGGRPGHRTLYAGPTLQAVATPKCLWSVCCALGTSQRLSHAMSH